MSSPITTPSQAKALGSEEVASQLHADYKFLGKWRDNTYITKYDIGEIVFFGGKYYQKITDANNTENDPTVNTTDWELVTFEKKYEQKTLTFTGDAPELIKLSFSEEIGGKIVNYDQITIDLTGCNNYVFGTKRILSEYTLNCIFVQIDPSFLNDGFLIKIIKPALLNKLIIFSSGTGEDIVPVSRIGNNNDAFSPSSCYKIVKKNNSDFLIQGLDSFFYNSYNNGGSGFNDLGSTNSIKFNPLFVPVVDILLGTKTNINIYSTFSDYESQIFEKRGTVYDLPAEVVHPNYIYGGQATISGDSFNPNYTDKQNGSGRFAFCYDGLNFELSIRIDQKKLSYSESSIVQIQNILNDYDANWTWTKPAIAAGDTTTNWGFAESDTYYTWFYSPQGYSVANFALIAKFSDRGRKITLDFMPLTDAAFSGFPLSSSNPKVFSVPYAIKASPFSKINLYQSSTGTLSSSPLYPITFTETVIDNLKIRVGFFENMKIQITPNTGTSVTIVWSKENIGKLFRIYDGCVVSSYFQDIY